MSIWIGKPTVHSKFGAPLNILPKRIHEPYKIPLA